MHIERWDYLIVTASNEMQGRAYETQLGIRRELGLLDDVGELLVVADPGGRRVGSGGSTLHCLAELLNRGLSPEALRAGPEAWRKWLSARRILIMHAGGDSRRLPAYGPCGKILVPVPGESDFGVPLTLFDRQLPVYLDLPGAAGQIVITSGDVLLQFDPAQVRFAAEGLTALACYASPEQASHHGVFCRGAGDEVRLFLQKPSPDEQRRLGAIDRYGQALLDIGVMSFDAATAVSLLELFGLRLQDDGRLGLSGELGAAALSAGLDFYREVCCGMGAEATVEHYLDAVRQSGSTWAEPLLQRVFPALRATPMHVRLLPRCEFLHFGTSAQIITSGGRVVQQDRGIPTLSTCLDVNNDLAGHGQLVGASAWVEGCRVRARLDLAGDNVVVGVDVDEAMALRRGACLDVMPGRDRSGAAAWFVRIYDVADTFKDTVAAGATLCGRPVLEWLQAVGGRPEDLWPDSRDVGGQTLWTARVFPAVASPAAVRPWLWLLDPEHAPAGAREAWKPADRYSFAEMAALADHEAFFRRREATRAQRVLGALRRMFRPDSGFSAAELAWLLRHETDRSVWISRVLREGLWNYQEGLSGRDGDGGLVLPRIMHSLGSALLRLEDAARPMSEAVPGLAGLLDERERDGLRRLGLDPAAAPTVGAFGSRAKAAAFDTMGRVILGSGANRGAALHAEAGKALRPRSSLRSDEIVWGRAPARLDLGGGWTDTPPYALEHGGTVVNAAVQLNGQPPIQAYARVIDEPVVRINSIDLGARLEVRELGGLLDYRRADSEFGLVKAALALSGFSPEHWPDGVTLPAMLESFGGGIEITTLAAIPKGSGLGTSSIMGAVIVAVLRRVMGRQLSPRELFHEVLRLEQALTTGGGWQDQIGGAVGGAKIIATEPGLVPDARIHYLPPDVVDPRLNGGATLLYYTGVTRLAKNILEHVVGRYLDRQRAALATLRRIGELAPRVAEALSRKDLAAFGQLVGRAWELNKRLDPDSSNAQIEELLERVGPHLHGAKLLGAGGGGFLLMVCRSGEDAGRVREMLENSPPNARARFFDFGISDEGLVVTVC